MALKTKRIYDDPAPADGFRVLVDRLWPRGIAKDRAAIDVWLKDVGPSSELRKWFAHREDRFAEFSERYAEELRTNPAVDELRRIVDEHPTVTMVYSAHSTQANNAVVLADYLKHHRR